MNTSHLTGKKVLIRADFNVPLDSSYNITDDTRMVRTLPTITAVLEAGASVILMSHLGRPKMVAGEDNTAQVEKFTLQHLVSHLSKLLGKDVQFSKDTIGTEAFDKALALKPGEILLLENTRFESGEKKGDEDMGAKLAQLADCYINDAFGAAHRKHASTYTVAKHFDKEDRQLGLLMQSEIESAHKVLNSPKRPLTSILGGAKVSDKIQLIEKLLDFTDNLLIGGGMSYTFTKALGGQIGDSLVEDEHIDLAKEILQKAKDQNVELLIPVDNLCADKFDREANTKVCSSSEIPDGWMGLDIGPKSIEEFTKVIKGSATILWNGPVGVFEFEKFATGTNSIAKAVAEATQTGAYSLIGGGDSVAAINKAGLDDQVSFISTGGGAMLEFLEGKVLPGIAAINAD
jgi:phosphoglycerate kinase